MSVRKALSLTIDWYSTGSAGLIQTISMFAHHTWGAAVVGLIATIGWVIQGLGNMYYYRKVRIYYIGIHDFRAQLFTRRYIPTIQPWGIQWKRLVLIVFSWKLTNQFVNRQRRSWPAMGQRHILREARMLSYYVLDN